MNTSTGKDYTYQYLLTCEFKKRQWHPGQRSSKYFHLVAWYTESGRSKIVWNMAGFSIAMERRTDAYNDFVQTSSYIYIICIKGSFWSYRIHNSS